MTARTFRRWTPADTHILRDLHAKGLPWSKIARALDRNPEGVRDKAHRLGLRRERPGATAATAKRKPHRARAWSAVEDAEILAARAKGQTLTDLACRLECSTATISRRLMALEARAAANDLEADDDEEVQHLQIALADPARPRDAERYYSGRYWRTNNACEYWWDAASREWRRGPARKQRRERLTLTPPAYRPADTGRHYCPPIPADLEPREPAVYLGGDLKPQASHVPPDFPVQRLAPGEANDAETVALLRRFNRRIRSPGEGVATDYRADTDIAHQRNRAHRKMRDTLHREYIQASAKRRTRTQETPA
jgi:hypothetical protein